MNSKKSINRAFNIYKIIPGGVTLQLKNIYSLEQVNNFESQIEAERWVSEKGKRKTTYTILEVTTSI